jgi:RNA polymerase sigma factor (sigma-70 family)
MANAQLGSALRQVRAVAAAECARGLADGQLLDRFLASRDQGAFAELIRRHGPLVLRVCRLVLGHEQDAEDAFQVTFLLLARNAASVRNKEALAGWLHGVAHRTALTARRAAARRRRHEGQAHAMTPRSPAVELAWWEVQAVLGEEVERLPTVYRDPFVLCCLEGKSRSEAARELGVKEGTVSSRLNRARTQLKERLARRGITLAAVLGAGFGVDGAAAAAAALARATAEGAARYAAGGGPGESVSAGAAALLGRMVKSAFLGGAWGKALLVLAFSVLLAGAGLYGQQGRAAKGPEVNPQGAPRSAAADDGARADRGEEALPAGALVRLGAPRLRHGSSVLAVAFSPDSKYIASASGAQRAGYGDFTASLWDAATGKELRRFHGHRLPVCSVAFSPDGATLATGSHDGTVRLWRAATGEELRRLHGGQAITAVAFSSDGKVLVSAGLDLAIRLWDTASGAELRRLVGHRNALTGLAFTPRGEALLSGSGDASVRLWDVRTGRELRRLGDHVRPVMGIALAPDGRTRASASGSAVLLWEVSSGKLRHALAGHAQEVLGVAFAADGRTLASGGEGRTLRLWDVRTGRERRRLVGHTGPLTGVTFSPDGKALASAGRDHAVRLWDVATGAERAYQALWALVAARRQAPELLRQHLRPAPATEGMQLAEWVKGLGHVKFTERERAMKELEKVGLAAEPALREALGDSPSLEVRRRVEQILDHLLAGNPTPEQVRTLRALEVLERLASPEARHVLETLARGAPGAGLTLEARACLRRLAGRAAAP